MTNSAHADHVASDRSTRRSLLGAGVAGAALAVTGTRAAFAAAGAPDEISVAVFAISIELAARDLYEEAIKAGSDDKIWHVLREQHEAYAHQIGGIVGVSADTPDADLFAEMQPAFATKNPSVAAAELENVFAATHTSLLAAISNLDVVGALASIAAIESRHSVVLHNMAGHDGFDDLYTNGATPLSMEA